MPDPKRIAIDLQPIQGWSSRGRGIGRYVFEQVRAIIDTHPEHVHSLLVSPRRGLPPEVESFLPTGLVRAHTARPPVVDGEVPDTYYVTSPFEFDLDLDEIWPPWARDASVRTVMTLYDLIPLMYPEHYLSDPMWVSNYWARNEFVRQADLLLCISEATASDARRLLEVPPERVVTVGTGVSERFSPPADEAIALDAATRAVEGLRPGFIMYTGGIDFRKNLEGLLDAYSLLPDEVRRAHQLVIVCRVKPPERAALMARGGQLGISDDLLLTGFVPDETLALMYQCAELMVFPSLYEGFGLPIAEAVLSGTLAIASDSSSMVELVTDPSLRFDASDPAAIARTIATAIDLDRGDERRAGQFAHVAGTFRWDLVADRTISAIEELPSRPRRAPARRMPRIALVTPAPPAESGIADYSWRLAHAIAAYVDVDIVLEVEAQRPEPASEAIDVISGPGMLERDRLAPYAAVVHVMGNSPHHSEAFDLMELRPGAVMIHEARFTGFFESYARKKGHDPEWFWEVLHDEYDGIERELGTIGWITYTEANEHGLYLLGPIVDRAERVLTTSRYTADLAALRRPDRRPDIVDVGFGYPEPWEGVVRPEVEWMATFGYQHEIKATDVVLEAFAHLAPRHPGLKLAIVGDVAVEFAPVLDGLISSRGLRDRVVMTGRIGPDEYESWLARADVAVQLRRATNGEVSAAVGDCLRAGIPTIVTALGPAAGLPDAVVEKVPPGVGVSELAGVIAALAGDHPARVALSGASREFAAANGFDAAARRLLRAVGLGKVAPRTPPAVRS